MSLSSGTSPSDRPMAENDRARGWSVGAITTQFDAGSTAAEVVEGMELAGRAVVVTGAASGIGVETARARRHRGRGDARRA